MDTRAAATVKLPIIATPEPVLLVLPKVNVFTAGPLMFSELIVGKYPAAKEQV
jgi:hypothetical protein